MTARDLARQRQQRRRERLRAGRCLVTVELDAATVEDALIGGGFLSPGDVDDRAKVAAALKAAVVAWAAEETAVSRVTP